MSNKQIAGVQTVSGTEALRIGMEFIKETLPGRFYLSNPTYGIFEIRNRESKY